jgi:hypothetical protein
VGTKISIDTAEQGLVTARLLVVSGITVLLGLAVGLFVILTDDDVLDFHEVWPIPSWLTGITRNDTVAYAAHVGLGSALERLGGSPTAAGLQWFKAAAHAGSDAQVNRAAEGMAQARQRAGEADRLDSLLCSAAVAGATGTQLAAMLRAGQTCGGTAMMTSAIARPVRVARGDTVYITASAASASALSALIDVEVYDPTGTKFFQQWYDDQVFGAGEERSFSLELSIPLTADAGRYVVKMGAFEPGWRSQYAWNNGAAYFSVDD